MDLSHYIVRLAGILITAGLIAELYSLWLTWKKKRTEAQTPLTIGVIYQAIGILIQLHFGMNIGAIWIIGRGIQLTDDAFPYSFIFGILLGLITIYGLYKGSKFRNK